MIQQKACTIALLSSALGNQQVIGSIDIDLGEYVGKGKCTKTFQLEDPNKNVGPKVSASVTVTELTKEEAAVIEAQGTARQSVMLNASPGK